MGRRKINYFCEKCGYKAKTKQNLINHNLRKNPCFPKFLNKSILNDNKYKCTYCNQQYTSHLKRHMINCSKKKEYFSNCCGY